MRAHYEHTSLIYYTIGPIPFAPSKRIESVPRKARRGKEHIEGIIVLTSRLEVLHHLISVKMALISVKMALISVRMALISVRMALKWR